MGEWAMGIAVTGERQARALRRAFAGPGRFECKMDENRVSAGGGSRLLGAPDGEGAMGEKGEMERRRAARGLRWGVLGASFTMLALVGGLMTRVPGTTMDWIRFGVILLLLLLVNLQVGLYLKSPLARDA